MFLSSKLILEILPFSNKKFNTIEGLRAIYCLLVVIIHCRRPNLEIMPYDLSEFINYLGIMTPDGFFFISGFIITHCYQKQFISTFENNYKDFYRNFCKYFTNRLARLYPMVFLAEIITIIINWDATNCLYEFFLVSGWFDTWNGNTPLWSLGGEFLMYFLFPLLLFVHLKINKENKATWNVVLSLIIPIIFNFTRLFYDYPNDFFPIFNFGPLYRGFQGFYIGICFYKIYEKYPEKNILFDFFWILLTIIWFMILIFCNQVFSYVYIFFLMTFCLIKSNSFVKFLFERKILLIIGEISFTIYCLHYPIVIFLNKKLENRFTTDEWDLRIFVFLGILSFNIMISLFLYYFYELPLRNYFRKKWDEIDRKRFEKNTENSSG